MKEKKGRMIFVDREGKQKRQEMIRNQVGRHMNELPEGRVLAVVPDLNLKGVMVGLVVVDKTGDEPRINMILMRKILKGRHDLAVTMNELVEKFELSRDRVTIDLSLGLELRNQNWPNEETKWRESRD